MMKIPFGLKSCYVDETTHPPYRKPMKNILYLFNVTNALEPTGVITKRQIDHYAVVRPGPAENMELEGLPGRKIRLNYTIPKQMEHFPAGLFQNIRFKSQW